MKFSIWGPRWREVSDDRFEKRKETWGGLLVLALFFVGLTESPVWWLVVGALALVIVWGLVFEVRRPARVRTANREKEVRIRP